MKIETNTSSLQPFGPHLDLNDKIVGQCKPVSNICDIRYGWVTIYKDAYLQ